MSAERNIAERNNFRMTGYDARQLVTDPATQILHRLDQESSLDDVTARQLGRLSKIFPPEELDNMKAVFSQDVAIDFCKSLAKSFPLGSFEGASIDSAKIDVSEGFQPQKKQEMKGINFHTPYNGFRIYILGQGKTNEPLELQLFINKDFNSSQLSWRRNQKVGYQIGGNPEVMRALEDLSAKLKAKVMVNKLHEIGDEAIRRIGKRLLEPRVKRDKRWENIGIEIDDIIEAYFDELAPYRLIKTVADSQMDDSGVALAVSNRGLKKDVSTTQQIVALVEEYTSKDANLTEEYESMEALGDSLNYLGTDEMFGEDGKYAVNAVDISKIAKFLPDKAFQKFMSLMYENLAGNIAMRVNGEDNFWHREALLDKALDAGPLDLLSIECFTRKGYPRFRRKASVVYAKALLDTQNGFSKALETDVGGYSENGIRIELYRELGIKRLKDILEILGVDMDEDAQAMTSKQKKGLRQVIACIYKNIEAEEFNGYTRAENLLKMLDQVFGGNPANMQVWLEIYRNQTVEFFEKKGIVESEKAVDKMVRDLT